MKKILIVYYSRTETTKKVAMQLAEKLGADVEEIKDTVDRKGAKGYLISGRDATLRKLTVLEKSEKNLRDYDLVIIGTPIWAYNVSVPVKTYLMQNSGKFKNVAFFCTQGGKGAEKAFEEMENDCGNKPIATVKFLTKDVARNNFKNDLEKFISEISNFVCDGTKL